MKPKLREIDSGYTVELAMSKQIGNSVQRKLVVDLNASGDNWDIDYFYGEYNDDLTHRGHPTRDIIKVYDNNMVLKWEA